MLKVERLKKVLKFWEQINQSAESFHVYVNDTQQFTTCKVSNDEYTICKISNLMAGSLYQIKVAAFSNDLESNPSVIFKLIQHLSFGSITSMLAGGLGPVNG
jgi:hypothetical protein